MTAGAKGIILYHSSYVGLISEDYASQANMNFFLIFNLYYMILLCLTHMYRNKTCITGLLGVFPIPVIITV